MDAVIAEYDAEIRRINEMVAESERLKKSAWEAERALNKKHGLRYIDRGPGFPDWLCKGGFGYHDSPREALVAAWEGH